MSDAQDRSDSEDFPTLFAREGARRSPEVGQVVTGRILQIDDETVFVDVAAQRDPSWSPAVEGRMEVKAA